LAKAGKTSWANTPGSTRVMSARGGSRLTMRGKKKGGAV
jgi:hypothetical protein